MLSARQKRLRSQRSLQSEVVQLKVQLKVVTEENDAAQAGLRLNLNEQTLGS